MSGTCSSSLRLPACSSDRAFRDKLRACTDPAAVKELLAAWPDAPAVAG